MRLKQRNGLLNLDFHDFSIIECCLSINQEWHKCSWILSGAVQWNGLLFEVSSNLLNFQHLCTLVLIGLYLFPSEVLHVAELSVCGVSRVNTMWAEQFRAFAVITWFGSALTSTPLSFHSDCSAGVWAESEGGKYHGILGGVWDPADIGKSGYRFHKELG